MMELPVVMPVAMVSTDWVGDPCCESGETEELLMAEGGTTTSWVCGPKSVLTWLGRARRVWSVSGDAMAVVTGGDGRRSSQAAVIVVVEGMDESPGRESVDGLKSAALARPGLRCEGPRPLWKKRVVGGL